MTQDSSLEPGMNHGKPARTSASTSLWAHLLRKDTARQSPNLGPVLPPITPSDKNGTSMRILLYDTQAHLDKFSERADKLFSKIDETKREMSIVNSLFQREHQILTEELVDLVNRSQTQLQHSIGTPAQTEQLERISRDVNARLEATDKRLDAIHSFNQTHSQLLQLQSQAIQSLQEQHGTILAALIPLLPLLQAIPLHIESARNKITDILNKPTPPIYQNGLSDQNCDRLSVDVERRRGKRSSSTLSCDSSTSPSQSKKARTNITAHAREKRLSRLIPIPSVVTNAKQGEFGSSPRDSIPPASVSSSRLIRQETTILPSPQSTSPVYYQTSAAKQNSRIGPFSPPTLATSIPSSKQYPLISRAHPVSSKTTDLSGKCSPTLRSSNATHPLPILFPNDFTTPSSDLTRPSVSRAPTRRLWLTTQKSREETPRRPKPSTSPSPQSNMVPAKDMNPNSFVAPHHKNKPILIGPIGPACHPAQHFPCVNTNGFRPPTQTTLHGIPAVQTPNASALQSHRQADSFALQTDQSRKPLLAHIMASTSILTTQAKNRERQSLRKEGRRFIPLDDSDDDDDDGDFEMARKLL